MTQPKPNGPIDLDELPVTSDFSPDMIAIDAYLWMWAGSFTRLAGAEFEGSRRPFVPDNGDDRHGCAEALICQWWGLTDDNAVVGRETPETLDYRGQGRFVLGRPGPGPTLDKP